MSDEFKVKITATAREHLEEIRNDRDRIQRKILSLSEAPYARGKRLEDDLSHLHSVRAGRYRIIYVIRDQVHIVFVKAVGLRREGDRDDIYEIASRLYGE
jgi:mRNA interferase RelE/StbE